MTRRISRSARSMLVDIREPNPAEDLEVHQNGDCRQRREDLVRHRAEEDEKDAHVPSQPEPGPPSSLDPPAHQAVVLVRRVTEHERADDRHEPGEEDQTARLRCQEVPGQTEDQEGVGLAVEDGIEPAAELARLIRKPRHLPVAAIDDGGELGEETAECQGEIPAE